MRASRTSRSDLRRKLADVAVGGEQLLDEEGVPVRSTLDAVERCHGQVLADDVADQRGHVGLVERHQLDHLDRSRRG